MRPFLVLAALFATTASAQTPPAWSEATTPFRIAGPVHYVGTRGLAVYAVVGREGTILIGAPMAEDAPQVLRNLAAIGIVPQRIKYLLNTHAHFDHAAGFAELRRVTGAKLVSSEQDATALRRGRHEGDNVNGATAFPPVAVDRIVRDREIVKLGALALTATLTPGHTPGCTTWSMAARAQGRTLKILFPCSLTVAGNKLIGNVGHPDIVSDYRRSFDRLSEVSADIVLTSHPEFSGVMKRRERYAAGDVNAFVAPTLLAEIVAAARRDFDKEFIRQTRIADGPR